MHIIFLLILKFLFFLVTMIASLTLMKDFECLDLLKETSGTQVYEERRQEIVFDSLNLLLVLNFAKNYVYSFPFDF